MHFFGPFLYRSHFHATTESEECERALAHLDGVIRLEGPSTIAAIVLESIPGTAGIMVPHPATWPVCASCATTTASSSSLMK